jgi:hypothetical protein
MTTERKCPILLALTVSLASYAGLPAGAQAPSNPSQRIHLAPGSLSQDSETVLNALRAPVPANELKKFAGDFTTLVHELHDLNSLHPEVQGSMIETQRKLAALTPAQWTALANAWDRTALSSVVQRLGSRPRRPEATPSLTAATPEPGAELSKPAAMAAEDVSATNTLSVANYGICAPTSAPSFLGADSIPSSTSTDYDLFASLQAANAALIPLAVLCDDFVEILGEGTNAEGCIPYGIAEAVAFAIQTSLQADEFCDSGVLGAENDAAYFNTIAIYNNLNTGVTSITNQLASTQNDLDGHLTKVDSDVNAHITAIDADIDTHVAAINTNVDTSIANANANLTAQITAIDNDIDGRVTGVSSSVANAVSSLSTQITSTDTDIDARLAAVNTNTNSSVSAVNADIDNHVAAATVNIDTAVANADTDVDNHLTAIDADLNTRLAAVDAHVLAQGSQAGSEITTLQAINLRLEIEQSLAAGATVGIFETPKAQGGYLELVGTTVQTVITGLVAAGQSVGNAQSNENAGNTAFAAGQFLAAYYDYMSAYQTAAK